MKIISVALLFAAIFANVSIAAPSLEVMKSAPENPQKAFPVRKKSNITKLRNKFANKANTILSAKPAKNVITTVKDKVGAITKSALKKGVLLNKSKTKINALKKSLTKIKRSKRKK